MLHTLCSKLHTEVSEMPFKVSDQFMEENQVVAVLSGGTEALFIDLVKEKKIGEPCICKIYVKQKK